MIHGHGGIFTFVLIKLNGGLAAHDVRQHLALEKNLVRRCKNIKQLSETYIGISLKTHQNNRQVPARFNALRQGPDKEVRLLKELQVAC